MSISDQRDFALEVVRQLRDGGFDALWAGGCVRDQLLGISPKDYDVATSATPDQVRTLFGKRRTLAVGASFGVITVLAPKRGGQIEVATFRTDGGYSDGRHPDQVAFSTPEHDAQRRDFTINGLFYDPLAETVLDYVDGQRDLAAGLVRAIGDPRQRIAEDKLRMLRAVRFAARFNFAIDPGTLEAIRQHASEIIQVSGERIGAEMRAVLVHPHRATGMELLRETGLDAYVLPEITNLSDDEWQAVSSRLVRLDAPSLPLALATLLAPLGDVRVADGIAERWRLANREVELADWMLDNLPLVCEATTLPWPRLQRILIEAGARELVALAAGVVGDDHLSIKLCRQKLALPPDQLNPEPLVTGGDLIAAGLRPGPQFRSWLEQARDAQLLGEVTSREEALRKIRELAP